MKMIYRKQWYTCNRCGAEIENLVDDVLSCLREEVQKDILREDYLQIARGGELDVSILDTKFKNDDFENVTIGKVFLKNEETIHLCHKCKKEFERFMRNESNIF